MVFSKYYALNRSVATEVIDPEQPHTEAADNTAADIADLKQSLKELVRRFNDVEFERAERTQLRGEFRSLDQKLKGDLAQVQGQMAALEERAANAPDPPPGVSLQEAERLAREIIQKQLAPIHARLEQLDARPEVPASNLAVETEARILESLEEFQRRLKDLESGVAVIAESSQGQADNLPSGLERLAGDIEELRVSLQNVTMRYSEIGELKKNHLILLDKVESFRSQLERSQTGNHQAASNRVPVLETEVLALRAEVRQVLKRMEDLEAAPAADLNGVMMGLEESRKAYSEQSARMQEAVEATLEKELTPLFNLPKQLADIDQRQQCLEKGFRDICEGAKETSKRISDIDRSASALRVEQEKIRSELRCSEERIASILARPPEEPRPPLEEDVHVIRETLDELRRFLNTTPRKP